MYKWCLISAMMLGLGLTTALSPVPVAAQVETSKSLRVPRTLAQTAADFLSLGQISPKGLPYREVVLSIPDDKGNPTLTTHGWVLAAKKGVKALRVLTWNGWTYPASSIGAKASVRADIEAICKRGALSEWEIGWPQTYNDTVSVSQKSALPFKAVLLQELGETALAQRLLFLVRSKPDEPTFRGEFTEDWMWPGFNRAIDAFRRSDDAAALPLLRLLNLASTQIGYDKHFEGTNAWVPRLLADAQRRVTEAKPASPPQNIDFLIWDLQNVNRPSSFFRRNSILEDEKVQRILARGDGAVEPLIEAYENDGRLTRFASVGISDHAPIPVIEVKRVADVALDAIEALLKTDYHSVLANLFDEQRRRDSTEATAIEISPATKALLIQQIRADWAKLRLVAADERPYAVLKDDGAGIQKWQEAIETILKNPNQSDSFRAQPQPPRFAGEPLRAKQNPSVSELLIWHSNQLANSNNPEAFFAGVDLTLSLNRWDKQASQAVILTRMRQVAAYPWQGDTSEQERRRYDSSKSFRMRNLLESAPAELGRQIYVDWLRSLPRRDNTIPSLEPLWKHRSDPFWQEVSKSLFQNPQSPWNRVLSPTPETFHDLRYILSKPLIALPEFKTILRRDLADKSPLGKATWNKDGRLLLEIVGTAGWSTGVDAQKAKVAPTGETEFRVGDLIAWELSHDWRRFGVPEFQVVWAQDQRDAALKLLDIWVAELSDETAQKMRY